MQKHPMLSFKEDAENQARAIEQKFDALNHKLETLQKPYSRLDLLKDLARTNKAI